MGAILCSGLGIFLALVVFSPSTQLMSLQTRKKLRYFMLTELTFIAATSVYFVSKPIIDWRLMSGSSSLGSGQVLLTHQGPMVLKSGESQGFLWFFDNEQSKWSPKKYPGEFSPTVIVGHDQSLWTGEQVGDFVYFLMPPYQGDWQKTERPTPYMRALTRTGDFTLGIFSSKVFMYQDNQWVRLTVENDLYTTVCSAGNHWLAVGHSGWVSGTLLTHDTTKGPLPFSPSYCSLAEDGSAWVIQAGLLHSESAYRDKQDGQFVVRKLPITDIREIKGNQTNAKELVIGAWGEGVYFTQDGGLTWQDLGLFGLEVHGLDADFHTREVVVSATNLLNRSGVWSRSLPPAK